MVGQEDLHQVLLREDDKEPASSRLQTFDWLGRSDALQPRKLGGKRTLLFTTGTICLWYMAYFGIFFNLVLFFRNVFGFGSGVAASETTNWMGSMFLASLLGALIAESFLGRLWTCAVSQVIAMTGMALMMIATNVVLSSGKTTWAVRAFFYFSIYLLSIGCGAFQSTLQSLGADQFDTDGDKAIFFTRYLILNNGGMALADTLVVYVVSAKGWLFGFGLATMLGAGGLVFFVAGIPFYRQYRHKGNPYQRALQVLVAATRKWRVAFPIDSDSLYQECLNDKEGKPVMKHTNSLRWLDKAATFIPSDCDNNGIRDQWKLSTVTEVEEMKAVLRLIPVWASSIFFNTIYSQAGTLLVEEGTLMNTSIAGGLTMEPATMNLFNILVVVLVAPLYNATVVPLARRTTGHPRGLSPLQRTGVGYVVSIIAVSLAAILEAYRLHCHEKGLSAPSIFWQVPEFVLLGFAQFLAGIGQLEFFYSYAPSSLRSLGSSFCLTCIALGSYVSSLLVWVVTMVSTQGGQAGWLPQELNDGHLDYFFWLLGGLAFLNFLCFTCNLVLACYVIVAMAWLSTTFFPINRIQVSTRNTECRANQNCTAWNDAVQHLSTGTVSCGRLQRVHTIPIISRGPFPTP
ncbi:hypothetical protein GOP47_0027793 [Adiantum capillus-veneris]|nr:hypothetical protein GOP47_0027793 [Adiantum capillus-veneris]